MGADPEAALAAARPGLEWIGEPDWHAHIAPLPFAAELVELRAECPTREEFVRRLPDAWVARLAVTGTPEAALRPAGRTRCGGRHGRRPRPGRTWIRSGPWRRWPELV
ncbi:hypothetical protein SMICM304S_01680 [Streptomyces microflavus]